ncbi:hypothetical protein BDD12DRAFT_809210 [Trichophaea hybrida]|nr:hypothetical protein BDD12DRAFT_809210 [Trichophaea hybrida]
MPGTVCDLILHLSHTAEYYMTEADIASTDSYNLHKEIQKIRPSKKDMRQLGRGNLAGVMTGEGILQGMKERDEKDTEKQANRAAKADAKAAKPPATPRIIVAKKRHVRIEHDGAPSTVPRYHQQSAFSITSDASSTDWHYHPRPTASRSGPARSSPTQDPPVTIDSSPLSSPLPSPPPSPTPLVGRQLRLRK